MSALDVFMRAAFAPLADSEQAMLGIQHIVRLPDGGNAKPVTPKRWRAGEEVPTLGLLYNCSAFRLGATRATLNEATRCMVIMLDDLGDMPVKSKASLDRVLALPSAVQPHAVIATRRDGEHVNCQACWFIVPVAPGAARDLVRAAATAGLGDPGASGGVRWARPPGSLKVDGNGFAAEMIVANLSAPRIGIGALADALGVRGFMGAARAPSRASNRGELPDGAPVRTPSRINNRGRVPDAALVRAAMAAIVNDLDRDDWVRVGMALKSCCGDGALADAEGLALFDDFSRRHDSYNERHTRSAWDGFRPAGAVGFRTLVWMARRGAAVGTHSRGDEGEAKAVTGRRFPMTDFSMPATGANSTIGANADATTGANAATSADSGSDSGANAATVAPPAEAMMGLFDGMTEDEVRAQALRNAEVIFCEDVRRGAIRFVGKLEGRIAIAIGYDEAKHAMQALGLAGGIALPDWKALRSIGIPAEVRCVAVVCTASDLDRARGVARRLNREGIEARVKLRTQDIPRETERDSLLREPERRLLPNPPDSQSS